MSSRTLTNIRLISIREFKSRLTKRSIIFPIFFGILFFLAISLSPTISYLSQKKFGSNTATANGSATFINNSPTRIVILNKAGNVAAQDTKEIALYLETYLNGDVSSDSYLPPVSGYPTYSPIEVYAPNFIRVSPADTTNIADLLKELKAGKFEVALILRRDANNKLQIEYHSTIQDDDQDENITYGLQAALNYLTIHDNLLQKGVPLDQQDDSFNAVTLSNAEYTPTPVPTATPTPISTPTVAVTPIATPVNMGTNLSKQMGNYLSNSLQSTVRSPTFSLAELLLYSLETMLAYCTLIAHGVVEEKSSRVMEIMICAATPNQLLMGKLMGVGLFALMQQGCLLSFMALGLFAQVPVANILAPASHLATDWSDLLLIAITALYMMTVLFLYGSLFAAVAAPLSRADEVQRGVNVLMYLVGPASFSGFIAFVFANSHWVRIISFFPFFTPYMMVGRMASGNINWLDLILGLIITSITSYFVLKFAAHIYRRVILYYGKRKHFWQLL